MRNETEHSRRSRSTVPRQRGMALVLALLFIVLLSIIVTEFLYDTQVEASFAVMHGADFEAYLAAKSGVAKGMALLMADLQDPENEEGINTNSTTQNRAENPDAVAPEGNYDSYMDVWATGIEPVTLGENRTLMGATIADEYGKINLNALYDTSQNPPIRNEAVAQILEAFFALRSDAVEARDLVEAILDWLDYDDGDEEHMGGAENTYYMGLENPYPCKNGPMDSIEELLLIKGMTKEFYFGDTELEQFPLSEYLTVHGDWQGRININTASLDVLNAVESVRNPDVSWGIVEELYESLLEQPITAQSQLYEALQVEDKKGPPPENAARRNSQEEDEDEEGAENLEAGQMLDRPEGIYRWDSYCFRIFGDGLAMDEVMVRVEAYVWRTPLELIPGGVNTVEENEEDEVAQPVAPSLQEEEALSVEEPMRLLSWKVIR